MALGRSAPMLTSASPGRGGGDGAGAGRAQRATGSSPTIANSAAPTVVEGMMRFFLIATVLISALAPVAEAFAQTDQPRTQPKMDETQDAKIKAEYLESIPYQPCPANVRFPNGRQICLGLPGNPFYRPYNAPHQ